MPVARSGAGRVLHGLLDERSAVAFIERCLQKVVRTTGANDAMLVLEDEAAGRQAFRVGRRPVDDPWAHRLAFHGPVGLHTRPDGVVSPMHADGLVALAKVAWRIETLQREARIDPLTGLLNRYGLNERLVQALERHQRYDEPFTLMVADVDRFKRINDRLGHPAGDRVLQLVGEVLRRIVRGVDVAARMGGDEFALLLADAGRDAAARVQDRLDRDLPDGYGDLPVTVSVGAATCPDDGTAMAQLHEVADQRLYEDKGRR